MRYINEVLVSCASVQLIQSSAQKSIAVVKNKKELDSNVDTCVLVEQN